MFYNGIANNGKMIKPFLTKAIMKDGNIEEEFEAEVVNPSLSSEKTLHEVREILRGVVTDGTGKAVNSELFPIAGKTGTAMIASQGGYSGYFVSFCGYFPSDNPKYTCFVGIRRPVGSPSGGLMPGAVFKRIAEGIHMRNLVATPIAASKDTVNMLLPVIKGGSAKNTEIVLKQLNQSYSFAGDEVDWVKAKVDTLSNKLLLEPGNSATKGDVPSVIGMGARDAIFLLENEGLKVKIVGAGKVRKQSLTAGGKIVKGSTITIELN